MICKNGRVLCGGKRRVYAIIIRGKHYITFVGCTPKGQMFIFSFLLMLCNGIVLNPLKLLNEISNKFQIFPIFNLSFLIYMLPYIVLLLPYILSTGMRTIVFRTKSRQMCRIR